MDATQGLAPTPTPTPSQQQQQQLRRRDVFVVSFIASLVCMTCAGTLYLFSAYSPDLVSKLRLSQTDINVIASFGGFGLYMSGPVAGWLADRFSVRPLIAASALFLLIGYVGMAAILEFMGSILPPTASLSVCYCLVGLGSSGIFNGSLSTNVKNFKAADHGLSVGLSVAFFGLSALFFSQLSALFMNVDFNGAMKLDTFKFLIFIGIFTGLVPILTALFILDPAKSRENQSNLETADSDRETNPLLDNPSSGQLDLPIPVYLQKLDALLLFLAFIFSSGPGLMYINNVGAIVDTLGTATGRTQPDIQSAVCCYFEFFSFLNQKYSADCKLVLSQFLIVRVELLLELSADVILNSACSRFFKKKIVSDILGKRYKSPRLYGLITGVCFIGVSQLFVATIAIDLTAISYATALLGFGYGAIFASLPPIVSLYFGTGSFGTNWGWFQWAPAFGGQAANLLFGAVVDSARGGPQGCTGAGCYARAFYLTGAGCVVSVALLAAFARIKKE